MPAAEQPDKEEAQRVKRAGDEAFVKGRFQAAVDRCTAVLLIRSRMVLCCRPQLS